MDDIFISGVDCHLKTPEDHNRQLLPNEHVQRTVSINLLVVTSQRRKCKEPLHVCPCKFVDRIRLIIFSDIPTKNSKNGIDDSLPTGADGGGVVNISETLTLRLRRLRLSTVAF